METKSAKQNQDFLMPSEGGRSSTLKWLKWRKPDRGWYEMNIDGYVNPKESKAGCRGVFRNDKGNQITGFYANLGTCTVDEAEAWAILKGLRITWEKGFKHIIIMGDSKRIIDCLMQRDRDKKQHVKVNNISTECKNLMKS